MPSGQWLRVTATFDSESVAGGVHTGTKTLTVYDDAGNLLASESVTSRYKPNTAHGLRIGAGANEETIPQFYFNGAIDDVRVYEQALSAGDVAIISGAQPQLTELAAPAAVIEGMTVDVEARTNDPSTTLIDTVEFYQDANDNDTLEIGTDTFLGTGTASANGWTYAYDTTGLTPDTTYTLLARATNAGSQVGGIVTTDLLVTDDYVILDDGDPGYSEYGSGWNSGSFDAGSAYDGDYRTAYFQQGTNIAVWNATDLPAGTFDVYVSYVDAANHISAASYRVYTDSPDGDGNLANHTKVGEKFVDQTTPVAADLVDGTQNWERIGRATVDEGGELSVELDAGGSIDRWAVADGVRLQRIDEVQGVVHDFSLHNGAAGATPRAIDLNAAFANVVGLTGDLTFSITGNSNPAVLESAVIDNANGFLTVVASETLGSTSLTISVDDDDADTDADASATFTITVNDNLVQNGSFEQIVTPNPWNYIHAIPEWTLESGPNFELQKNLLQTSADGSQYLELDAHPLPGSTTISQTVNTVAGATYELRFAYSGRPGTALAQNRLGVELADVDNVGIETHIPFALLNEFGETCQ